MSQTEIHIGTLVPVQRIETLEALKEFVAKNNITPEYYDSLEDYLAEFSTPDVVENSNGIVFVERGNDSNKLYAYANKKIFKFEDYKEHDDCAINSWAKGDDGKIRFITSFYNGGTCFSEMLEKGLEKLLRDK